MILDHIGIAVKDLKSSNDLFSKLLNQAPFKSEKVIVIRTKTQS